MDIYIYVYIFICTYDNHNIVISSMFGSTVIIIEVTVFNCIARTDLQSTCVKMTNTYYIYFNICHTIPMHLYTYIIYIYIPRHTRIHILQHIVSVIHQNHVLSVLWVQNQKESCGIYEQSRYLQSHGFHVASG